MASIQLKRNSMGLPMNIERSNPIPLDSTEVWYSKSEAEEYAKNGPTSYVGQHISVVDTENGNVEAYIIKNLDGDLLKLSDSESTVLEWTDFN